MTRLVGKSILEDEARGASVTYHPGYLERGSADALLRWMVEEAPWQREAPVIFGKAREVRRRTCSFGEPGTSYAYSGVKRVALPWPELLRPVVHRLNEDVATRFSFGLCNHYPDGDASIGKHVDAERDIVRDSAIVGLSLGATRDFVFYDQSDRRVAEVALEHGSIVVMWGTTQRYYKHGVPPRKRVREPRVSITFRVMASASGSPGSRESR